MVDFPQTEMHSDNHETEVVFFYLSLHIQYSDEDVGTFTQICMDSRQHKHISPPNDSVNTNRAKYTHCFILIRH